MALALLLSLRPVLAGAPLETCLAALATPRLHLARALGIGRDSPASVEVEGEGEGEGADDLAAAEEAQAAEAAAAAAETAVAMCRLWRRAFGDGDGTYSREHHEDSGEDAEDAAIASLCVVGEAELAELEADFAYAVSTPDAGGAGRA